MELSREEYHRLRQLHPWQLTFDQFIELLNYSSGRKWIKDYDPWTIEKFNWVKYDKYPLLIDRKRFQTPYGPRWVEFRQSNEKNQYAVRDSNSDEYLRDDQGGLIYYTDEEVLAKGWPLYRIDIFAFDGRTCIGYIGDEWGGTLLAIAQEYWRSKIGLYLYKLFNKLHPYRCSGGFTNAGYRLMRAVHQSYVQDALAEGLPVDPAIIQSSCDHQEILNRRIPIAVCEGCRRHRDRSEDAAWQHNQISCIKCMLTGTFCRKAGLLVWNDGSFQNYFHEEPE